VQVRRVHKKCAREQEVECDEGAWECDESGRWERGKSECDSGVEIWSM
jgi:hypothetical protein